MGIDRPVLLLLVNVLAITAITSLILTWFLGKRDKKQKAATPPQTDASSETSLPEASTATLAIREDIRQYVARRAPDWVSSTTKTTHET